MHVNHGEGSLKQFDLKDGFEKEWVNERERERDGHGLVNFIYHPSQVGPTRHVIQVYD